MPKVLVAISGGLDSVFTTYLLKKKGYTVDGIHFSNGLISDTSMSTIQAVGQFFGIHIQSINIHDQFEQLLDQIDIEMCHGMTPNICVMCAKNIKFTYIVQYGIDHGYDYIATGHYVQIIHTDNDVIVKKALDKTRDQSYGFGIIPKDHLTRVITPLGIHIKKDIRILAATLGLPYLHKESHGLCFTELPFNQFYPRMTKHKMINGHIVINHHQSLMEHQGQQLYTRGQKINHLVVDKKIR